MVEAVVVVIMTMILCLKTQDFIRGLGSYIKIVGVSNTNDLLDTIAICAEDKNQTWKIVLNNINKQYPSIPYTIVTQTLHLIKMYTVNIVNKLHNSKAIGTDLKAAFAKIVTKSRASSNIKRRDRAKRRLRANPKISPHRQ